MTEITITDGHMSHTVKTKEEAQHRRYFHRYRHANGLLEGILLLPF